MKNENCKIQLKAIIYALSLIVLATVSACNLTKASERKDSITENKNSVQTEIPAAGRSAQSANPAISSRPQNVAGTYVYETKGKTRYYNTLVIDGDGSKLNTQFEGMYVYPVNDKTDETFHITEASGDLTLKNNVATGSLTEGERENPCRVSITFSVNKATVKSTDCGLNVSPDGVYTKENAPKKPETMPEEKTGEEQDATHDGARIVFNVSEGVPNGIMNLMPEKDREGCEGDEVLEGKVVKLDEVTERAYELTLALADGKRRSIHVGFAEKDKINQEHVRQVIAVGSRLKIKYILCGNGAPPTPTEIHKQ